MKVIRDKILSGGKDRQLSPGDIIEMYHQFMMVYGYISLDDWKKIPIKTTLALWSKVQDEIRKREEWRVYSVRLLAGFAGAKKLKDYK